MQLLLLLPILIPEQGFCAVKFGWSGGLFLIAAVILRSLELGSQKY